MKRSDIFGALAQLVEQWPFKPFVTGSNPVRPNVLINILIIILILFSYAAVADDQKIKIMSQNGVSINGNFYTQEHSDSVFLIIHGTRGFKSMEVIDTLAKKIAYEGHDVLTINLSYNIDDRSDNFLPCDIIHKHNEHDSVNEIIVWYKYLLSKNKYKNISLVGHSRGALNAVQASFLLNDERIRMYLLAPIIDTYLGTSKYYKEEHNLPYDEVIVRDDDIIISDEYPPINFLFCENANVSLSTFKSYLDLSGTRANFPFTFNIVQLLESSENPIMIFSGTDDEILLDSYKKITEINKPNIKHYIIDGGDHFFRDIFLDDVIDVIFE